MTLSPRFPARRLAALALLLTAATGAWGQFQPYSVSYRDRWGYFPYHFNTPITGGLDLNGDGRTDLVVPVLSGPTRIFLSQGNARFVRKTLPFWAPAQNFAVAGGDFDGDGRTDLAYTGDNYQVRVLRNLGGANFRHTLAFATQATGEEAQLSALVGGDFNGDGRIDLIALDRGRDTTPAGTNVLLAWGQAGGQFATASNRMPTAGGVVWGLAGDFTGDGRADLLAANRTGDVSLSRYDTSTATPQLLTALQVGSGLQSARVEGIASGDIDGNGRLDAAVVFSHMDSPNSRVYMLRLLRNNGAATALQWSGEPQSLGDCSTLTASVRLGDHDGDGKSDILVSCSNGVAALLYGHGDFTFDAPAHIGFTDPIDASAFGRGLARGDYDGNGKLDIAVVTQRGLRVLRHDPAADRLFADGFQSPVFAAQHNNFVE